MTIQTNNQLFTDLKVTKISPKGKEFHAMTFLYRERKMVIGHSATEGGKFFWYIEGRGTKETSKSEFWKWIKQYEGNDARKIAGYAKLMEPVSLGPVVDVCDCGRGVDHRTRDYSGKTYGVVLCKKCQKKQAATSESGADTVMGVPLLSIERLTEMKPYQREALLKQVKKALDKVSGIYDVHHEVMYSKLVGYEQDIMMLLPSDDQEHYSEEEGQVFYAGPVGDEVESASDDQREEQAEAAGVKAGNEEAKEPKLKGLRTLAKAAGIKGYSKMKKEQLIEALAFQAVGAMAAVSRNRPF